MPPLRRIVALVAPEAPVLTLGGLYALVVLLVLPKVLVQDGWLALVSGREVARHGLPSHDTLAVWTHGVRWVDQQWLAHVGFYGLAALGGVKLALIANALLVLATAGSALALARRLGGSPACVTACGTVGVLAAPWALQLRAQTVAELLFVWLLWLLVSDARRPSRRVLLVLPLLVLWANVHGTAVLGTGLAAIRGATLLRDRSTRVRGAVLVVAPWACLVASPYGLSLAGYYRRLLFNPLLPSFLVEWRATTLTFVTLPFFALAAGCLWLLGRHGRRLPLYDRAALLLTLLAALLAVRSIVWFALAGMLLLPLALDGELPGRAGRRWRAGPSAALALGATAAAALALLVVAVRPASWFERGWPAPAAQALAAAASRDPSVRVLADDRLADWLLWADPSLAGRVAYDVRFELFDRSQFDRLLAFHNRTGSAWLRGADGFRLVALDRTAGHSLEHALLAEPGTRLLYQDDVVSVIERAGSTSRQLAAGA